MKHNCYNFVVFNTLTEEAKKKYKQHKDSNNSDCTIEYSDPLVTMVPCSTKDLPQHFKTRLLKNQIALILTNQSQTSLQDEKGK